MYMIGVAGYSGVGKTTFQEILTLCSSRIGVCSLDEFYFNLIYENTDWFIKTFGEKIFKRSGGFDLNYYIKSDKAKIQAHQSWSDPEMVRRFYKKAKVLSSLHDIIIVDFNRLPGMPLWEECDKRVIITSDDTERYARLQTRTHIPCTLDEAKLRDENTRRSWKKLGTNYVVIHNNCTENFQTVIM